jgi:type II secretory pathway pseudopilin PulG
MLVVVAIIALVAGLSFPAISAGLNSVRMVSATDSIAAMLNGAVTRAQRRQQAVELVVSFKDNSLTLYSNEPGFKREFVLPAGLAIEAVLPSDDDPSGAPRRVMFLPGAAVPGIGIQITNRGDAHRLVKLDPMTGFPRVESVNSK